MSGSHFPAPKHVWAPTGGWWFTPKNANSNFVKVLAVAGTVSFLVFKFGQKNEYVAQDEYDEDTIRRWEAAAKKVN